MNRKQGTTNKQKTNTGKLAFGFVAVKEERTNVTKKDPHRPPPNPQKKNNNQNEAKIIQEKIKNLEREQQLLKQKNQLLDKLQKMDVNKPPAQKRPIGRPPKNQTKSEAVSFNFTIKKSS